MRMTENQLRYRLRKVGYALRKSRRNGGYAIVATSAYGSDFAVMGMDSAGTDYTANLSAVEAWAADRGII